MRHLLVKQGDGNGSASGPNKNLSRKEANNGTTPVAFGRPWRGRPSCDCLVCVGRRRVLA